MAENSISTSKISIQTALLVIIMGLLGWALLILSTRFETKIQHTVMTTVTSRNISMLSTITLIAAAFLLLLCLFHLIWTKSHSIKLIQSPFNKLSQKIMWGSILFFLLSLILSFAHYHISAISLQALSQGKFIEAKEIGSPLQTLQISATIFTYASGLLVLSVLLFGGRLVKSYLKPNT